MLPQTSYPLVLAGVLALGAASALAMGSRPRADDAAATHARIAPLARVEVASAPKTAAADGRSGEEIYQAVCGACHETGVAGAPKTGDKAAWAPRIATGLDAMVQTAKTGKNAMPPNGGSNASEAELTRAIVFMANKSGASFK